MTTATGDAAGVESRRAWAVAIAAAFANAIAFGTNYTFGTFFESMADDFGAGLGATALVFGITTFLFFGLGLFSGPLSDRVGPRLLVAGGAVFMGGGLLATSRVDSIAVGYLTYGLGVGVGAGLFVTPMVSTVGGWFDRRRAVAIGIAMAGNGIGTLVLVPVAERLIEAYGWRTGYVILAVVSVGVLATVAIVIDRPPIAPPPPAIARLKEVSRDPIYRRLWAVMTVSSVVLIFALGFTVKFATDAGVSKPRAALLVGIIGASSVIGRVGLTAIASRTGPVRMFKLTLGTLPFAFALWLLAGSNYALLICYAVLLGVAYGGFVAIGPEVLAVLYGVIGLGTLVGGTYLGAGLGGLVGPPLAGFIADATNNTVPRLVAIGLGLVALALSLAIPERRPSPEPAPSRVER